MATNLSTGAHKGTLPKISTGAKVAIVTAEWNSNITEALTSGATTLLDSEKVEHEVFHVPGAIELTYAASALWNAGRYAAIIVFGCVIRGGTPHFDYVCDSVTRGVTEINLRKNGAPVIFGVLTVDNEQDALDRAGGCLGNKGTEAAEAAIKMIHFMENL